MPKESPVEFRIPLTDAEVTMFENCATADVYDRAITTVRKTRDGAFPLDWWENMINNGRMARILARWGKGSR